MKRKTITLLFSILAIGVMAQTPREEIRENPNLAGINQYAYPLPTKQLTPAPAGKTPFYISHYGRHGSRYLTDGDGYAIPREIFRKAAAKNMLTEKGEEVLAKLEKMYTESLNRAGDLTLLGAQQHQEIAQRMYERFPEVFAKEVVVDAKSTIIRRSMLSMTNELIELSRLNPTLDIKSDASEHDLYYLDVFDQAIFGKNYKDTCTVFLTDWFGSHISTDRVFASLFKPEFMSEIDDKNDLYIKLFALATIVQNCEIRHELSLYDIFTSEELYDLWEVSNMWWFCYYGSNELNGATKPFSQKNLLSKIISEADSCLVMEKPGATLRFGHEIMVLPLVCLMDLNGYGKEMHPSELVANNWAGYRIFPMGCNVQIIFYRANLADKDVWVKVLLNEEEAVLPFAPVDGPYYRWTDFKNYYTTLLDSYKEN